MNDETRQKIENIRARMSCVKDFKCMKDECRQLCKAEKTGSETHLKCLDQHESCMFSVPYAGDHYCICPLRNFLERNMSGL